MAMQILRTPRGLHALGLAERLLRPFCVKNSRGEDMFAPVVCLLSEENESLFTQLDVTKAMNRVCDGAGSRFFYKFSTKRKSYSMTDFIDEHWDEIDGSSCRHCDRLPSYRDNDHSRIKWRDKNIESIRVNCSKVYRPLKAGMERSSSSCGISPSHTNRGGLPNTMDWWRGYRPAGSSVVCMS